MSQPYKITAEYRSAIANSEKLAVSDNKPINTAHLLYGVLSLPQTLGSALLGSCGLFARDIIQIMQKISIEESVRELPTHTMQASEALTIAEQIVRRYGHQHLGSEHLLLALLSQEDSAAQDILMMVAIDTDRLMVQLQTIFREGMKVRIQNGAEDGFDKEPPSFIELILGDVNMMIKDMDKKTIKPKKPPTKKGGRDKDKTETPYLDHFATDLTALASENRIDPIIGRDEEIERVINILGRRRKNNPALLGDPGVGKTAIVEGLALRIVKGDVPEVMKDKKILSLNLSSLVAGTKYRGEFEERITELLKEATSLDTDTIIFIDELHTIVGAGSAEGGLETSNILKPYLARGELQLIGATTFEEYRKYIEKDQALARRFQEVAVEEPNLDEAVKILQGLSARYAAYHNVEYTPEALAAAVHLSARYITDRFLPDKAIDLIDEAGSRQAIRSKSNLLAIRKLENKLQQIVEKKSKAITDQEFDLATQLRKEELAMAKEVAAERAANPDVQAESVTADDIIAILASTTGISKGQMQLDPAENLVGLERKLSRRIKGQSEAITEIADAIRRSRAGLASSDRPLGSFLFLGPSGIGKTELVKVLASEVYGNKDALIRVDMSEYMEAPAVSRMIGASAGYIGYEEGGVLTKAVRRKPYSIVLFDEIEKAHPDVINLLLQIMDEGVLTDSHGKKVDFRNTIVIMTSNIGGESFSESAAPIGFNLSPSKTKQAKEQYAEAKSEALKELEDVFSPEFLGRVDSSIVFSPLTPTHLAQIARLESGELLKRLKAKQIALVVDKEVYKLVAKRGYTGHGARGIRKTVRNLIENPIADLLLKSKVKEGDTIEVSVVKDEIKVRVAKG